MEKEIKKEKEEGTRTKTENKDQTKTKEKGNQTETGQHRVVINKEANEELEKFVSKTCEGNESILLNKSDVANYVFMNLNKLLGESDMKNLRSLHFDEKRVLQMLLKQHNDGMELPLEIKRMVRDFCGVTDKDKKRTTKNTPDNVLEVENKVS